MQWTVAGREKPTTRQRFATSTTVRTSPTRTGATDGECATPTRWRAMGWRAVDPVEMWEQVEDLATQRNEVPAHADRLRMPS
ncbi:MAG: hypothetical protein R6U61_09445 [Thermoplasmata archaeon]